ncbi:hypothetical protein RMCBS344292_05490 [Rhizopus microsporus]|nr:hypothetical protein RMCBS344292_05490 [Rhizopus microsporus]
MWCIYYFRCRKTTSEKKTKTKVGGYNGFNGFNRFNGLGRRHHPLSILLLTVENHDDEDDLLTFRLPLNYLSGQDILSRRILNDQHDINLITTSLLQVKIDTYNNAATEWRNGTRCDVLYLPETALRNSLPPILIEIQRNVNEVFMRRLMMYALNVVVTHARSPLPIVLIFCIDKVTPQALQTKFKSLPDMPWMKSFPCDLWAKNCYLVSNQPLIESDATLDPLHALSLFLAEQQPALFQHYKPEDKTINLIYKITKNVATEGSLYESNFTTQVDTICSTNHSILTKAKKKH